MTQTHPLASRGGINMLDAILTATDMWRDHLTKPQRELLLSTVAGYPTAARADVRARLVRHGLITAGGAATDAGRFVVKWRIP